VIDSKTSVDITAQVLTQIILELDTQKLDSFPVPLLLRVIRVNDQLVKDFIEKYFNQALHSFLQYQAQLEEQLRQVHGLPAVYPAVSAWTKAMLHPFTSAFAREGPSGPPNGAAPEEAEQLRKLVQVLQRKVSSLQRKSSRKGGRQPQRKPARKAGAAVRRRSTPASA
jgi:polyhydroxyalkanoate synthesis regulator protein